MKKNRALSLLELLVTMVVLFILVTLLMPVFAQAKAAAFRGRDEQHLRQVGLACALYADDYDQRQGTTDQVVSAHPSVAPLFSMASDPEPKGQATREHSVPFQKVLRSSVLLRQDYESILLDLWSESGVKSLDDWAVGAFVSGTYWPESNHAWGHFEMDGWVVRIAQSLSISRRPTSVLYAGPRVAYSYRRGCPTMGAEYFDPSPQQRDTYFYQQGGTVCVGFD